jgi:hypothetical protein
MHRLMEAVIILHPEPIRTVHLDSAGASAEASAEASAGASAEASAGASAEASAGASAEEDGGGKPENPALRAALEHQKPRAAASKRAHKA